MKNPNGYGGISKLPGNRRKPYRVRLTAGWQYQTDGKPLQKYHTLGYYTSRRAALIALADYNKRPYDLNLQHITLGELYNQWYDKHTVRLSRSSRCSFTAAWKKCTDIANEPIKKVKKAQMQAVLDNNQHLSPSVQTRLKTIFNGIFRLALENDLINVDYSRYLENYEYDSPGADYFVEKRIGNLLRKDPAIDTIVLGCTHYPLLLNKILKYTPRNVRIVPQGEYVAYSLKDYLQRHTEIETLCTQSGTCRFLTTESPDKFMESASIFLRQHVEAERVVLE